MSVAPAVVSQADLSFSSLFETVLWCLLNIFALLSLTRIGCLPLPLTGRITVIQSNSQTGKLYEPPQWENIKQCVFYLNIFILFIYFFSSITLLLPTHLPPPSCTHAQSCNPMEFSPPGSSVHGLFQARILEWVAISFSIFK